MKTLILGREWQTYNYCNSDHDGDTFYPVDRWIIALPRSAKVLEKTQSERNNGRN